MELYPTDRSQSPVQIRTKKNSPNLKNILSVIENAKTSLNLVFLDCCRSVPYSLNTAKPVG